MEKTIGVRKGAWTYEEDKLLKACINNYGEGKWHLVPARAGLNRCRKSCRLRWLNYLKPNIKRGSFAEDEIDMILRLHKLLGNRWSLIAGRIPGRTANDVKNYWHTHLLKKVAPKSNKLEDKKEKKQEVLPKETKKAHHHHHHEVIKPQPRTFATNSTWLKGKHNNFANDVGVRVFATPPLVTSNEDVNVPRECDKETMLPTTSGGGDGQPSAMWWENLLNMEDQVDHDKFVPNSLIREKEENSLLEFSKNFFSTEVPTSTDFCWDFNFSDVNSFLDF